MATEIDKRVVEMEFDNKNFEKNCKESLTTLEKLKMALNFDGAKGLDNMTKAANKVDLSNISKGAEAVQVRFSAMQVAGMTAIQEITRGLMNFGKNVWSNTFGQIRSGGMARTLKIEQANFQMQALAENMDQVKNGLVEATAVVKAMGQAASDAVDGTAYGLDAASAVASQLMASGLLDPTRMKDYLRAIAGAASMTGRSYEDIGNIFTTVASNGRLMTMQLRQFSAAGLNLSATLAAHLGKTEAQINDMVTKGKISFEDFADALNEAFGKAAGKADDTFNGVTSNIKAQLSRIGQLFTDPFVENVIPFLKQVKARIKDVRTVLVPVAKTWTKFFEYVSQKAEVFMKNLNVAKLRPFVNGIENILVALIEIIWTIGRAIKEVFPQRVQDEIQDGVRGFERLTRALIPTQKTLNNFKNIVKAVLIPLKALWTVAVAVARYAVYPLVRLFISFVSILTQVGEIFKPIINSLLDFVTNGEFLSNIVQIIASTLVTLANVLTIILECVMTLLSELAKSGTFQTILDFLTTVANLLMNVITVALLFIFGVVNDILSLFTSERISAVLQVVVDLLDLAVSGLITLFQTVGNIFEEISKGEGVLATIVGMFMELGSLIKDIFAGEDISDNLERLEALLDQMGVHVKNAWDALKAFLHDIDAGKIILYAFSIAIVLLILSIRKVFNAFAGIGEAIRSGIENVVGVVSDLRTVIKGLIKVSPAVQLILAIAVAIGVLTISLKVLGEMRWEQLLQAGIALGIFAGGLLALGLVLSKIDMKGSKEGLALIPVILGMAVAVLAISAAVVLLGKANLTLQQVASALLTVVVLMAGVAGALALINLTAKTIEPEQKKLIVTSGTMLAFALAVTLLTKACIAVSAIPFKQAMTGLAAVAGLVVALAGSMALLSVAGLKFGGGVGATLFVLSFILVLKAIQKLSEIPFEQIVNGLKSAFSVIAALSSLYLAFVGISLLAGGATFVQNVTKMLSSLAAVVALSVAAIVILGGMDTQQASKGIAMIFLISLIFTLVTKMLLKTFDKFSAGMKAYKDASILKSFSRFLIAFSACLIILSVAAKIASNVPIGGFGVVIGIMVVLAGCIALIEYCSAHTKRANMGVIISFIAGIVAILTAMMIMTFADVDKLYAATVSVTIIMLALSVIGARFATTSQEIQKSDKNGKNVGIFIAFIAGLIGIIAAVATLVKFSQGANTEQLSAAIVAVAITMTLFIAMIGTMAHVSEKVEDPKKLYALALSIAILVGGIVMIAGALVGLMYTSSQFGNIWDSLALFGMVLLAFAGVAKIFEDLMMTAENLDTKRIYAIANTVVIMSSVLLVIVGAISAMTAIIDHFDHGVEKSIVATLEILAIFAVMMSAFNKFISENTFENNAPNGILKMANSLVIMSSVLLVIAGAIGGLTYISSISGGALNTLVSFGSVLLTFVVLMKLFGEFLESMKSNEIDPKDIRSMAVTIVILSASLTIIAGAIGGLTYISSISGGALNTLVSFGSVLLTFVVLMKLFGEFLESMKSNEIDPKDIRSMAVTIVILSASLTIIAGAIGGLTLVIGSSSDNWWKSLIAFGEMAVIFAGVCVALGVLSKKANPKKMAVAAVAIDIAAASLLIIAGAIAIIAGLKIEECFEKAIWAMIRTFTALAIFLGLMALLGNKLNPGTMLVASASIVIGALAIEIIANAIKKGIDAFRGVNPEHIEALKKIMTNLLILLGVIAAAGGIAGAFGVGGAMVIGGILAMMAAFVIFAKGVDILASAVDKFVDAVLKINNVKIDYTTIAKNIRNGIQGACDAIVDSAPNVLQALKALFVIVLAAVASVIGAVVAIGSAFLMAFIEGILAALPEALAILSEIMRIIVDWLKEPGQLETIKDFFRLIGEMLVEIIKGALEGLLGWLWDALVELDDKVGELVFETTETYKHIDEQNHQRETKKMQEQQAQNVIDYYSGKAWSLQDENGLLVKKYDQAVVDSMINDFNRIAEAARESGEEVSDSVVAMVKSTFNDAPEEMLTKLDKAYGMASESVDVFVEHVEVANDTIASGMHTEEVFNIAEEMKEATNATDQFNSKLQNESTESSITLEKLKEKAAGLGEGFMNSLKNIDIKKTASKLGVDAKKLGSTLGKITGISFGEDYEETLDYYMEDAMKKIYDKNGQWQYKWQTFKNEQGERIYSSAEAYANAMMDESGNNTSYALTKLAEFLGINLDVNDALTDGIEGLGDFGSAMDSVGDSTKNAKSKLEEFRDGVRDSIAQAMHGIFDEVSEQEYIDPEEMLYRMEENTRRVGEWAQNIATLAARGMSEGLLNELKDMGPQGAAKVQAFVDMTDDQLKQANRRWTASSFLPDYATKSIEQAYRDAGFNASLGFAEGVDAKTATDAMSKLAKDSLNALESEYEIESPSKRTMRDGQFITQGLTMGMTNATSQMFIRGACTKLGAMLTNTLQQSMPKNKFAEMGANMLNGLPEGWNKALPNILTKITALANQIIARFMNAWKISSPSKAFAEIGEYAMAGLSVGFADGEADVDDTVQRSSNDILNAMKENINAITDNVGEDGAYQPVIRPVFDLTAMDQGYNDIQSWFTNNQGFSLNGNISRLTPTTKEDETSNQMLIDAIKSINNDEVVNELVNLRSDISELQSVMTNLQVVMNTGALVGQLTGPLDQALGAKALLNSRGRY